MQSVCVHTMNYTRQKTSFYYMLFVLLLSHTWDWFRTITDGLVKYNCINWKLQVLPKTFSLVGNDDCTKRKIRMRSSIMQRTDINIFDFGQFFLSKRTNSFGSEKYFAANDKSDLMHTDIISFDDRLYIFAFFTLYLICKQFTNSLKKFGKEMKSSTLLISLTQFSFNLEIN